ncbi:two-component sensor histidine kinase [Lacrimispora xylanolytica]|uniref:histidine kinase n=1 Tax=Lacrimispora xylanolytica TaxID=29375 RepID=A0ABY7AB78_9FIRM|nr:MULTISPECIES: HAMP domain-containing sensor histidine kinase [Clostridia]WAJ23620.1 HAMP domain-containing sensor histidine kinase [Lacrimispora xylanolytica]
MDTKLKNRHKISILLAIVVIVSAAAVMVGLYPFFKNESARYEEPVYQQQTFLKYLVYGNYVLSMEQVRNNQGDIISPFQFFFPKAAEEMKNQTEETVAAAETNQADADVQEGAIENEITVDLSESNSGTRSEYLSHLRQKTMRSYNNWKNCFDSIRNSLDYQILNENGQVISDHSGGKTILGNDKYEFQTVLKYDGMGRMEVVSIHGDNTARLLTLLQDFGDKDPMMEDYWEQFLYEPDLRLQNPKNITITYGMTADQITAFKDTAAGFSNTYDDSDSILKIFVGLICAVTVLAFLFSFLDVTLPDSSRIFRTPFEIVTGVGCGGVAFGAGLTNLVIVTNQGDLFETLLRANFLPGVAGIMVKLWNLLWWSLPFAVVYWAVLCLRDVLSIGIKRYLRERTLIGWFCGWLKMICIKVYHYVGDINLKEQSDKTIFRIVGVNFLILAILCSLWFFGIGALFFYSILLFFIMRKYYRDLSGKYRVLLKATNQIAEGNLEVSIEEDLSVFEPFKKEIQKIQSGFKVAVDEEVKSQKLKTDLISNMSHDLKTPLTAIITYVNLLKDERVTPEQRKAYIDILEQKSMRLKSLIEDLFEISKANSNNVTLNLEEVDIVSLLKEVSLELSDKIEESTIDFRWNLPDEKIVLPLDGQKTYRIFDNLLTNIIKYAMPNTRAYIDMKKEDGFVVISLKNVSAAELTFNPNEITERFARGDQSRNTEGSGLGMAIAKSFVELQNGKLFVEIEADLFRVSIRWPVD